MDRARGRDAPPTGPRGAGPDGPRPPRFRGLPLAGLAVLVVLHALIAWMPFELDPPARVDNAATRLDDGGLTVDGQRAVARAPSPVAADDAAVPREVAVELVVEPAHRGQHGPARILAWSADHRAANLMIGQERADLIVRLRDDSADGRPALVVPEVFAAATPVAVTVHVTEHLAAVEVAGHDQVARPRPPGAFATWDLDYGIRLGDEHRTPRTWQGRITSAVIAVDGDRRDLLAPGVLSVPPRVWYVPDRVVEVLEMPPRSAQLRSVLHLLAFVPVGWLLCRTRPGGLAVGRVVGITFAVSVILQLGKVLVAGRHPSLLDVGAHLAGALTGVGLAVLAAWAGTRVGGSDPGREVR